MAAKQTNLVIEQGATFRVRLTLTDKAGTPVDLTGCLAKMQARETEASPDALLELSTGNGRITIDGPRGALALTIPAADTAAMTFKSARYDLEVIFSDGSVIKPIRGGLSLIKEVTR